MAEVAPEFPTADQIDARLRELAELYDLGIALREARFVGSSKRPEPPHDADRVREQGSGWKDGRPNARPPTR